MRMEAGCALENYLYRFVMCALVGLYGCQERFPAP